MCKELYLFLALLAQCDAFAERILVLGDKPDQMAAGHSVGNHSK